MNIAFIVSTFPPYRGGVGNVAFCQARELARLGNEVAVITPLYDKSQNRAGEVDGVKIRRVPPVLKYGNAAFVPQVFGLLKNFDVIYLHYPFFGGALVCWLHKLFNRKKKFVVFYHMDVVGRGAIGLFFKLYTKIFTPLIIKSADKVIGSSMDYLRHSNIESLVDKRFAELPFGVDLCQEKKKTSQPEATVSVPGTDRPLAEKPENKNEKMVLFVGGLDRAHYFKGVKYLIEAMKIINGQMSQPEAGQPWAENIKCQIVGDGDMRRHYESLAKKGGIEDRVEFAGGVSNEELAEYYKRADVLVLPSVDKSEAFGLVLIEAMACGKPVIASNLPGVRSVVEAGVNGFLVEPKNASQLANRIEYIINHPNEAKRLGEQGRKKAEKKYDWKTIGKELVRILQYPISNEL